MMGDISKFSMIDKRLNTSNIFKSVENIRNIVLSVKEQRATILLASHIKKE